MNEKTVKIIYNICTVQFGLILLTVFVFCKPLTKVHLAYVGLSAALGLLISGTARRSYQAAKDEAEKQAKYKKLDETLEKIRQEEKKD